MNDVSAAIGLYGAVVKWVQAHFDEVAGGDYRAVLAQAREDETIGPPLEELSDDAAHELIGGAFLVVHRIGAEVAAATWRKAAEHRQAVAKEWQRHTGPEIEAEIATSPRGRRDRHRRKGSRDGTTGNHGSAPRG